MGVTRPPIHIGVETEGSLQILSPKRTLLGADAMATQPYHSPRPQPTKLVYLPTVIML